MRWRSALLSVVCAGIAAVALGQSAAAPAEVSTKDGMLIHISHGAGDAHRLLMAMKMATIMAEGGRPVLVYCDIKAVTVLVKDGPDVSMDGFPPAKTQLAAMLKAGVRVRVCPTCLKVAGYEVEDLVAGVALANRDEFFAFTKGRILTLDY
jgi:predicted peroxiredoxin